MATPDDPFTLAHWRRAVAELYAAVRQAPPEEQGRACEVFRAARDGLFRSHPQTPLSPDLRAGFTSLDYFPYDPAWRLIGALDRQVERETFTLELPADGVVRYTRVARIRFMARGQPAELSAFWIEGYGGGLFVPFRDATSGATTYGGGRYLYDTIKGADLGVGAERIVLDFNYAYNPSCAYNDEWVCPLSPPENRLLFAVDAGEKI
ncbi:MAG TPA: DUF1684 domain-containing protein [Roseiflexaceae bacterium]|jgi:uncharacterized protein